MLVQDVVQGQKVPFEDIFGIGSANRYKEAIVMFHNNKILYEYERLAEWQQVW